MDAIDALKEPLTQPDISALELCWSVGYDASRSSRGLLWSVIKVLKDALTQFIK